MTEYEAKKKAEYEAFVAAAAAKNPNAAAERAAQDKRIKAKFIEEQRLSEEKHKNHGPTGPKRYPGESDTSWAKRSNPTPTVPMTEEEAEKAFLKAFEGPMTERDLH